MCSTQGTLTLTAIAQATALAPCATFTGSLAIGDAISGELTLDGIQEITDDLVLADVPGLSQFVAPDLRIIEGSLHLENVPQLTTFTLSNLTNVGNLNFTNAGASLRSVDLSTLHIADMVYINGTALQSLEGLGVTNITGLLQITNNVNLHNITLGLQNIGSGITVSGNDDNAAAISFPALVTAGYLNIAQASSIHLPLLQTSSLQLVGNSFTNLSLPSFVLSTSFVVENNPDLLMLTAPLLQSATAPSNQDNSLVAMQISNNEQLDMLGFHSLAQVDGAIFNGTFRSISLDSLKNMTRTFSVYSTNDISSTCAQLDTLRTEDVIKDYFSCSYSNPNTSSVVNGTGPNIPNNNDSSKSGTNHASVIGGSVGGVVAFFVLIGLVVVGVVFWRMRRQSGRRGHGIELQDSPKIGYGGTRRDTDNPFAG